jgi:SAM-dependent methyltransferase
MSEYAAIDWSNAGASGDTVSRYLDLVTELFDACKHRSMDLLGLLPGMKVLEVGCGLGRDAEALAIRVGPAGHVTGADASADLIAQANARTARLGLPLSFGVEDAQALSFADASFDAAREDRMLQHLPDPARAVREMARVVRPGGRVVLLEPDWDMVMVASDNIDVGRAVQRHKTDLASVQGSIGRRLRELLVGAGCRDVTFEPFGVAMGSLEIANIVLALRYNLDGAVACGWVTAADAAAWWDSLEARDRAGTFFASIHGVISIGTAG